MPSPDELLEHFRRALDGDGVIERLANGLIGTSAEINGPFGPKKIVYADYVASGRALTQVEQFVLTEVLPYYANSHTEASYCGSFITRLRKQARATIARLVGADERYGVIFTGSGATAGINRLVHLLGIHRAAAEGGRPCVIIGPYEHHSNILPWRDCGAEVVEIAESEQGGPDMAHLDAILERYKSRRPLIGTFSAASNVTGITTNLAAVVQMLKQAGAIAVGDYAGAGPYLPISVTPAPGVEFDAIAVSPHKFIGGPAASGILILRCDAATESRPTWTGGGTVRFVSPTSHIYSENLEIREEAGTPNVIGDIRAALAFLVKDAMGEERMAHRNADLTRRAFAAWKEEPNLELLGNMEAERLPIFSFRVKRDGGYVHHQLLTRLLSDRFGIQARGGCSCAGPYVHRLLDIGAIESERLRHIILSGEEIAKPGFVRLNFSVLLRDDTVDFIIEAVRTLAQDAYEYLPAYQVDPHTAIFSPIDDHVGIGANLRLDVAQ